MVARIGAAALLGLAAVAAATPAAAQLHPEDSSAVIAAVHRYHAALAATDSVALRGMLMGRAVLVRRGTVEPLRGEVLASEARWARAVERTITSIEARTFSQGAVVYLTSTIKARANPALLNGTEAISVVFSRLGRTWFIELIHTSLGQTE